MQMQTEDSDAAGRVAEKLSVEPNKLNGLPAALATNTAMNSTSADIGAFLASEEVKALKRLGVDSLGIARRYFTLVQDMQVAVWELQVADGIRALCMSRQSLASLSTISPPVFLETCVVVSLAFLLSLMAERVLNGALLS